MNIWTSFVHVVYEQVFFPKVLMCNRWFSYSWKIINALKKLIFKNILFILVGLALIVIGAYIQIAAKEFLDFLSDNYLNTPIFIIIIGKKKLIFIIIEGEKPTYFQHLKSPRPSALIALLNFWSLYKRYFKKVCV